MHIRIKSMRENILMFSAMRPGKLTICGFVTLMSDGNHTVTIWHEELDDQITKAYRPNDWPSTIDDAVFRMEHS